MMRKKESILRIRLQKVIHVEDATYIFKHTYKHLNINKKKKLGKYITKCPENMQAHSYLIFPSKHTFPLV